MKNVLLAIAMTLTVATAGAQSIGDITDSGTNEPRFGMHIDWNLNSPSTSFNRIVSTYQNGSGISAGAFYNMPLYKNLYFEPGLSIFYNTMIISQDVAEDMQLDYPLTPEGSLRNSGFRVPLNFGYRFDFTDDISVALFTGPQFNYGISLKQHTKKGNESVNLYEHGWRRFDTQWLFGLRFYYSDNWIAEISGGVGMTSLVGGDRWKGDYFRRNTFTIGVGYLF